MELENVATGDIDIEDFLNFEEEKSKQVPYIDKLKKEFYPGDACLGCGPQIVLKLIMQMLPNHAIVTSDRYIPGSGTPCAPNMVRDKILVSRDPMRFSQALSEDKNTVCFIDEKTFLQSPYKKGNYVLICFNTTHDSIWKHMYAYQPNYMATASIGFIEDFLVKLHRAGEIKKSCFIDICSPCYVKYGFSCSESCAVARSAVSTGLWPLFELKAGKFHLSHRPEMESINNFFSVAKKAHSGNREDIQHALNAKWKKILLGKFWEM